MWLISPGELFGKFYKEDKIFDQLRSLKVMTALGIVICYFMGRSLAWNWLSIAALIFLIPFTFGLYYIPESPPWLVYNDEEDLAFRSMSQIR